MQQSQHLKYKIMGFVPHWKKGRSPASIPVYLVNLGGVDYYVITHMRRSIRLWYYCQLDMFRCTLELIEQTMVSGQLIQQILELSFSHFSHFEAANFKWTV